MDFPYAIICDAFRYGVTEAIPDNGTTFLDVADAVIAELKLHPVETLDRRYMRWVTRWQNNPDWNGGE